jgi:hypothetical protein
MPLKFRRNTRPIGIFRTVGGPTNRESSACAPLMYTITPRKPASSAPTRTAGRARTEISRRTGRPSTASTGTQSSQEMTEASR